MGRKPMFLPRQPNTSHYVLREAFRKEASFPQAYIAQRFELATGISTRHTRAGVFNENVPT